MCDTTSPTREPPGDQDAQQRVAIATLRQRVAALEASEAAAKREAAALRQRVHLLEDIVETSTDAIFVKDLSGRYILANHAFSALVHKPVAEVIGQDDFQLFPADMARALRTDDLHVLKTGDTHQFEEVGTSTGSTRHYASTKGVWRGDTGQILGVIGFARDVTEHRAAEHALRDSEERYRRLVELSPDAIVEHQESAITFVNPAGAKLVGATSPASLIGRSVFDFVPAPGRELARARIAQVLQSGQAELIEEQLIRLDGEVIEVEVAGVATSHQQAPAVQVMIRDVTARKRAEAALRASEERFRNLIEGSIQGILIQRGVTPLFVNQAWADAHGYTMDEILEMASVEALIAPPDRQRLQYYRDTRVQGEDVPNHYEYQGLRKDGTTLWIDIKVTVVEWEGEPAVQSTIFDISERKAAEIALRESEERFRNLIEGSLQGILIHREDRALFANQTYARMFGYETPDHILALPALVELIAPHDRPRLLGYRASRLAGGAPPTHYEYQGVRRDGSLIWLDMQVRAVNWLGGRAIQSTVVDITERKRAEAELRESEARYRLLVENTMLGVAVIQQGQCRFANPAYAAILGYGDPAELQDVDLWQHIPEAERERLHGYMAARRRHEPIPECYEVRAMKRDGTAVWLEYTFTRTRMHGERVGLAMVQDITTRKQAEATLRASEAQFRALVEHSLAGIYIIQDGRYQYVNPKFAEIFGYPAEHIMQHCKPSHDLVAEHDRARVQANLRARLEGHAQGQPYTLQGKRKDGALIDLEVHGAAMTYRGQPAVIGTLLDITERKRTEAALLNAQRLVSIGTFAAGIAHEINNPLGGMILAADDALELWGNPDALATVEHCLLTISHEGERCARTVKSILQFARKRPMDTRPADLNHTVREVVKQTAGYARQHGVHLRLALGQPLPSVWLNATLFGQAIVNLLHNAIESGAQVVQVQTARHDNRVLCRVTDNGRGLSPEERNYLFDPFYTTRQQTGGTGLGLSITHGIIEAHGASISVESNRTQGTTFTIRFRDQSANGERRG